TAKALADMSKNGAKIFVETVPSDTNGTDGQEEVHLTTGYKVRVQKLTDEGLTWSMQCDLSSVCLYSG
ncbi:hypothetical protein SARC_16393, partial [Sphaeroforma arctica JP610]